MREAPAENGQGLKPHEFSQVRRMMYENFGVDLEGKEVLIEARLGKKMRELGHRSFRQYYEYVQRDPTGEALTAMVDALTTNHTSFFREPQQADRIFAAGKKQRGPLEFRGHFAHDVNRFGFEILKMIQVI